jgi:sulfiredoxin
MSSCSPEPASVVAAQSGGEAAQQRGMRMLKARMLKVGAIYVPTKRRTTLEPPKVAKIAESILANGLTTPILVREDGNRYVLVEGLHRLEACKSLGEETIAAYLVQARRH